MIAEKGYKNMPTDSVKKELWVLLSKGGPTMDVATLEAMIDKIENYMSTNSLKLFVAGVSSLLPGSE